MIIFMTFKIKPGYQKTFKPTILSFHSFIISHNNMGVKNTENTISVQLAGTTRQKLHLYLTLKHK